MMGLVPVAGQRLIRGKLRMQMLIDASLLRVYFESQNSFGMDLGRSLATCLLKCGSMTSITLERPLPTN